MTQINSELVAQNLYSGWKSLAKSPLIKDAVTGTQKKVLVIDDNFDNFRDVYYQIIGEENIIEFFNDEYSIKKFKNEHKVGNFSGCVNRINRIIDDCCIVISDLYLFESHGTEFFSTPDNAENISGFTLNKEIKKVNPMLPVMMFTESNKVWNYQLFNSYGIDEWVVKFDSPLIGQSEALIKKSFFNHFEDAVLNLLQRKPYLFLLNVYKNINNLPRTGLWWDTTIGTERKEVITIINESLVAIKNLLNKQFKYEQILMEQKKIYGSNSYECSAIISQLGNIVEIIYHLYDDYSRKNADSVKDGINLFLLKCRNLAAHKSDYRDFTIEDVILAISLVNFFIGEQCSLSEFINRYKRPRGYIRTKECLLFWFLIQFRNLNYSIPAEINQQIFQRATHYLDSIFIKSKNGEIDANKLGWFKNFMKDEPGLQKFTRIKKGKADYKIIESGNNLFVELSIPDQY